MITAEQAKELSKVTINSINVKSYVEEIGEKIKDSANKGLHEVKIKLDDLDLFLPEDSVVVYKIQQTIISYGYDCKIFFGVPYDLLMVFWND